MGSSLRSERRLAAAWVALGVAFLGYHLAFVLAPDPAVDLAFRVGEARYFRAGSDPYLVLTEKLPRIDGIGPTAAYSFVSYLLVLPLTFVSAAAVRELLFVALEGAVFFAGLRMVGRSLTNLQPWMLGIVGASLLGSVFFLQHVQNLNYAIVGSSAATLTIFSRRYGKPWQGVIGLLLVAVKPTFAIPVALIMIARREWRVLTLGGAWLSALLIGAAAWVERNPIRLLLDASNVADRFNTGYEGGLLFLAWNIVAPAAVPVGVALCVLVVAAARNHVSDERVALAVALLLGLSLFYNHVHAWVGVFPLILIAAAGCAYGWEARSALALLLGFVLIPRLLQLAPVGSQDTYMIIHNAARFSILTGAIVLIARHASRHPTSIMEQGSPKSVSSI